MSVILKPDSELRTQRIMQAVYDERVRQEALKASGKFRWTCADNDFQQVTDGGRSERRVSITNSEKGVVLGEEFGEAMTEVVEEIIGRDRGDEEHEAKSRSNLRKELIQVAAVAVAWVESLDARGVK